jgi:predicted TPR repeat methyltransferase
VPTDFDERARTWDDDPAKVRRAQAVAAAIRAAVPVGPSTRLLEYGAGTGLVAQSLAEHVGALTLADPSAGMREVMVAKVAAGALPADTRIWDLDLASEPPPPDERFELLVTVMALHHIPDLAPVLAGFAELLEFGGHLGVVDLEAEDGSFHADDPGFDGHHGFARDGLTDRLDAAGFTEVRFATCFEVEKAERSYPLFLATATRRAA